VFLVFVVIRHARCFPALAEGLIGCGISVRTFQVIPFADERSEKSLDPFEGGSFQENVCLRVQWVFEPEWLASGSFDRLPDL
jgi:hypothetical protein